MLIKYQALIPQLQKKLHALYVLTGSDHYLLNDAAFQIKKAWRERGETDEKILYLYASADWSTLQSEANSYSLFAKQVLLDARFEKKSIDAAGKAVLVQYLQNVNPRCLIILHANAIPAKQLQWLSNNEQVTLVQITPLTGPALQQWIAAQLQQRSIRFDPKVPGLIHQYTQGNLLGCAQIIEKLSLISNKSSLLMLEDVQAQLVDQCEYQLYELGEACLNANAEKALHLLRQSCNNRIEPTLILWLLTQEVRLLIQLAHAMKQQMAFVTACNQHKIWPQRTKLYEAALTRLPLIKLYQLLQHCKELDGQIKSNQSQQIWHGLEQLALEFCPKKPS